MRKSFRNMRMSLMSSASSEFVSARSKASSFASSRSSTLSYRDKDEKMERFLRMQLIDEVYKGHDYCEKKDGNLNYWLKNSEWEDEQDLEVTLRKPRGEATRYSADGPEYV